LKNYYRVIPTKNLLVLKKTVFVLAIGWTILIGFLCLITFSKLPSFGVTGTDKYVHTIFHLVFTILWGYYITTKFKEIILHKIFQIVVISIVYGIIIEILQETITTTRQADLKDVFANIIGASLGFALFFLLKRKKTANINK
jgi:VanZ family protein